VLAVLQPSKPSSIDYLLSHEIKALEGIIGETYTTVNERLEEWLAGDPADISSDDVLDGIADKMDELESEYLAKNRAYITVEAYLGRFGLKLDELEPANPEVWGEITLDIARGGYVPQVLATFARDSMDRLLKPLEASHYARYEYASEEGRMSMIQELSRSRNEINLRSRRYLLEYFALEQHYKHTHAT
tara:strand:+ start:144 stop:710 length:567 start_codon:yes stop_codon:yes gene_type:complete